MKNKKRIFEQAERLMAQQEAKLDSNKDKKKDSSESRSSRIQEEFLGLSRILFQKVN